MRNFAVTSRIFQSTAAACLLGLFCCGTGLGRQARAAEPPQADEPRQAAGPLSPADSLATVRIAGGLRMELVAAEPDVIDPVAVRFDEQGRMWVVEMRDYPHGPAEGEPGQSRVRILTDPDGDGRYTLHSTFADKLTFATGVQPWRGGAFVTLAGQVAYFPDANGDGVAETPIPWFTGFAQENSQLRANHPRFGLDNQIYVANGLRGGTVVDARDSKAEPTNISGMDFRFNPVTGQHAATTGAGQFGLCFDDYGNRFVCTNRNPLKHIVLPDEVLRRNSALAAPSGVHDVAPFGEDSRLYPISRAWTTSNLHAGQFTAACGVAIYRGDALPSEFHGNGFTCDPTGNLVHREIIKPAGGTFTSQPAHQGVEFLASTDEWFRPVNLETGPDGALYLVDMYRAVIEHPQFMPAELKERPDLRYGDDRGRIYRIVADPPQGKASLAVDHPTNLAKLTNDQLLKQLAHPNAWQRETVARLIYERQTLDFNAGLENLVKSSPAPLARIHALWILQGLKSLPEELLLRALRDGDAHVREQAVILAAGRLESSTLRSAVMRLHRDPDAKVRFQVALALGNTSGLAVVSSLRAIALAGADDPWTRLAVATAVPPSDHPAAEAAGAEALLREVLAHLGAPRPGSLTAGQQELVAQLTTLAGAASKEARQAALARVMTLDASDEAAGRLQFRLVRNWLEAARRQDRNIRLSKSLVPGQEAALNSLLAKAEVVAADAQREPAERIEAISLLGFAAAEQGLSQLAQRESNQSVRAAALAAFARTGSLETWQVILKRFAGEPPSVRRSILDAALSRAELTVALLDAIESKWVRPTELDPTRSGRLLRHGNAEIRDRATKLLAASIPADRQQVLADYQQVLEMTADPARGKKVFGERCAVCHRIGEIGVNVAPDISDSRTKTPIQILTDILQPNRAIDSNYISYTIVTTDGRALTGIIAAETGGSVTIRQPENKTVTLTRGEIEEMQSSGVSLMPEGLEKTINHQQMADLVAFIKSWRYLDGRTPLGNNERRIEPQ